jgi:hypothetical protein
MRSRISVFGSLTLAAVAVVAACSEQGTMTGPTRTPTARPAFVSVPGSPITVCSTGGTPGTNSNVSVALSTTTGPTGINGPYGSTTTAVVANQQGAWHAPIGGSVWITYPGTNLNPTFPPAKPYDVNAPNFTWYHYSVTFTVDAGYTGQITSGSSYVDNLIGNVLVDNTGTSLLSQPQSDLYNAGNYNGATPLAWSASATGITAGVHTVDIYVENNDSVQPTDPTALDFCFTVTQTLIPTSTTWCSPGFWKNHEDLWTAYLNTKYSVLQGLFDAAPLSKKAPAGDPTIQQVVENPDIYGGPATNSVADYLSHIFFGTPYGAGVESCPGPDAPAFNPQ